MNYSKITDWELLRRRYLAFWNNQVEGNAIIAHIQNPNPTASKIHPESWMSEASESKYLNPEKLYRLKQWKRSFWNWHTDLFKYVIPSYGPNVFAGFCGGKVEFGVDTVWHAPVISSLDESSRIHFDCDNRYWKALLDSIDYAVKNFSGEIHLGLPDFGGPADWISTFMGTENFLIACIEEPDKMRDFALRLADECNEAFDITYDIISRANDGSANWMPVWYSGKMGTVQDDMAINFSPEMFADIFMPAIRKMAGHTDKTVLHWHDGCAQHLDNILLENKIDLIQFGHDPNTGSFRNFIGYMRKIQNAGKKLFISCVDADDVEFFIENLTPQGLMMIINTENDDASKKMEANVRIWTMQRLNQSV